MLGLEQAFYEIEAARIRVVKLMGYDRISQDKAIKLRDHILAVQEEINDLIREGEGE